MFSWFRPTCPLDPHAKTWLEGRLAWLADEFGRDVFVRRAIILPEEEFFPDPYDGSEASVLALLGRVCAYMDADPANIAIALFDNQNQPWLVNEQGHYLPHAAGLYEAQSDETVIHLEASQLDNPVDVVGTLAHELAHQRLLGEGRLDPEAFDNELLTDLTVVFHGLGLFLVNQPRVWPSQFSTWPGTDVRRPEYMSLPMYGYALAHAAWLRGQRKPDWMRYLNIDARGCFKQALRYLWETDDSTFRP